MDVRFLLGPAGSGKTYRCLEEIRSRLIDDPLGPPLILLAPRQATYQLELQLLSDTRLSGYTRLQIVSFERLASWLLEQLGEPPQDILSEEGRLMVLRALLHRHHAELKTFHECGRSAGFAQLLSNQLREVQQHRVTSDSLRDAAERLSEDESLGNKLRDLALLYEKYREWLDDQQLPDAGTLLDFVIEKLKERRHDECPPFCIEGVWLDGVAELTPQEMGLISALVPYCENATLAFCLESEPKDEIPWLSSWSVIGQTFRRTHAHFSAISECSISVEILNRNEQASRFTGFSNGSLGAASSDRSPNVQLDLFGIQGASDRSATEKSCSSVLAHIEGAWTLGRVSDESTERIASELTLCRCAGPEQEAVMAAREVLSFVQAGNRFRDCAVLLRQLETHSASIRRVFTRYEIPFFMDQRESVAHHPMAELTRGALCTVLYNWRLNDWFGVLKSGLTSLDTEEVDQLETAAIEFGWEGGEWFRPLTQQRDPERVGRFEQFRVRVIQPFENLRSAIKDECTGEELAQAIRELWAAFEVEQKLETWATESDVLDAVGGASHVTVWEEMQTWLANLERAFSEQTLPLREWLPILEAGLSALTVGVIPPAVDQVLIGAVDRSRNPDLKLAMVLGLNEGLFPRPIVETSILTEQDRMTLEGTSARLRGDSRLQLGHERYFGYIAFTRAREKLVLGWSEQDASGKTLNQSPLVDHVQRVLPNAVVKEFGDVEHLNQCVHSTELLATVLKNQQGAGRTTELDAVAGMSTVRNWVNRFSDFEHNTQQVRLEPPSIAALHGDRLKTSASRLEQFAACPFQYFVNASLRARERLRFEVDARKTGTFMHEVLRQFHEELDAESLKWRDLTSSDARARIARIAGEQQVAVANGVLSSGARNNFLTQATVLLLQDFVVQTIDWMASYQFDPIAVELSIGDGDAELPWWEIDLSDGRRLAFRGSVDRVDAAVDQSDSNEICLNVLDYKSGQKTFDQLKTEAGLQLQLPSYLAALCAVGKGSKLLAGRAPKPTGMFYVRIKDSDTRTDTRNPGSGSSTGKPFEHTGRFSFDFLSLFDAEFSSGSSGQFSYRLKADGAPYGNSREIVSQSDFQKLIDDAEKMLKAMGDEIMSGNIAVDPYRKGSELPCEWCDFKPICRIDPWSHTYRPLRPLLGDAGS